MFYRKTRYPERFTTSSESDPLDYVYYTMRKPTFIGNSTDSAQFVDGEVLAARRELSSDRVEYFLDPDMQMVGQNGVFHFVWIAEQWVHVRVDYAPRPTIWNRDSLLSQK